MERVVHTVLEVGLEKPVKILHITDVHLTVANDQDTEEMKETMQRRKELFRKEGGYPPHTPSEYFEEAIKMAEEMGALLVVTGDVCDLNNHGCKEEFHRIADGHDMMFSPGGHETQCRYVRTIEEGAEYIRTTRPQVQAAFPEFDFDLDSRVVNGLNIVTADNAIDYYSAATLARFKKELEKGLPIIVFSHDPIFDRALNTWEALRPTEELTDEERRISHEMIDLINTHPLVKATFAGHLHSLDDHFRIHEGKPAYVTPSLFKGACRLIEVR